jgi:hypothetical protein
MEKLFYFYLIVHEKEPLVDLTSQSYIHRIWILIKEIINVPQIIGNDTHLEFQSNNIILYHQGYRSIKSCDPKCTISKNNIRF